MYKSIINLLFSSITGIAALSACSMAGYQKIEEMSLPHYQKGTPVMSDMKVMCRAQVIVRPENDRHMVDYTQRLQREAALTDEDRQAANDRTGSAYFVSQNANGRPATNYTHPPLDFMVTYDRIWDVTVYPTPPHTPPKYPQQLCQNGISTQVITSPGIGSLFTQLEPEYKYDVRLRYNLDPSKGAVRVWRLPNVSMDGLNYRATMVGFIPMIIEGDKLPTGSNFRNGIFTTNPHTKKEVININGREWQRMTHQVISGKDVPEREGFKAGESSTVNELYTTKVGNYIFAVVAIYTADLATHAPDWLAKRQEFLRHWLESFKFEPIPPDVE